ncbi:hypothetical protein PtA15_6A744 [Puccinia triticina]|uniref:AMP-dependent synthetase/ligase domain-containing protein n=1 Tax=Puccinia triticina TaxID=208348 RepID=A0ABY7CLL1_9BASI|nr:uncharacterized protein PtA15_6A744 [Puccinia triticina]WAQ86114.1 hypothetical protein PtA15_6A744 [Puccinia triticina]WAR56000.1 hypothetical protein PtB15_6B744 [Puccinia triticina]
MSALPPYAITSDALPVKNDGPLDLNHQAITGHFRNAAFPHFTTVETPEKRFPRTYYEVFNFGLGQSYDKPCLGHRPTNPASGELEPFFVWQSYKDIDRRRTDFGSGLLRLQAEGTLATPDRTGWTVGIWTHNRPGQSRSPGTIERSLNRTILFFTAAIGAPIGYSCGDNLRLLEDVQLLKPTIFLRYASPTELVSAHPNPSILGSVPRVLNRIYQAVLAQLDGPGFKGSLGRKALQVKLQNLKTNGTNTHFLWDRLVFNKVKQALGGRVRIIGTGSAPISPDVVSFLKVAFITQVSEGYGSTENSGTCTKCFGEDMDPNGTVGPPQAGQEIKLVDVPDMKYFSTDKPFPRGEICVRGEPCIPAYYKDEAKTAELIDAEGWQHSGDIGLVDEKGRFKIIDRIKNLVKLAQGEYVALEKVEGAYSVNPLIAQIYLHGDSLKSYLVAVIVPDPVAFQEFANKTVGKPVALDDACQLPAVRAAVLKDMEKTAGSAKLLGFERIKNIFLTMEPFSIENELLTPTFKLKRPVAKAKFADVCAKLYLEHDAKAGESKMKL